MAQQVSFEQTHSIPIHKTSNHVSQSWMVQKFEILWSCMRLNQAINRRIFTGHIGRSDSSKVMPAGSRVPNPVPCCCPGLQEAKRCKAGEVPGRYYFARPKDNMKGFRGSLLSHIQNVIPGNELLEKDVAVFYISLPHLLDWCR